ncbi:MAG: HAD family hydrolase [Phycisphaerae bacterium]
MDDRRYDALFIDFYGTISAGDRAAVASTCRHIVDTLGLTATAECFAERWGERFFATIDRSNHDAFQTLHACEQASLRDTLRDFAVPGEAVDGAARLLADIEAYWADPPLHDDVRACLAAIDLPICCVSNADAEPLAAALRKHDLRFDAVVTSEQARCYKPDPEIFRAALRAMGVQPRRVMHVGDSRHSDVAGAARLGITTTWLCRNDRIHDIGERVPDHTISSLAELPPLLDR